MTTSIKLPLLSIKLPLIAALAIFAGACSATQTRPAYPPVQIESTSSELVIIRPAEAHADEVSMTTIGVDDVKPTHTAPVTELPVGKTYIGHLVADAK